MLRIFLDTYEQKKKYCVTRKENKTIKDKK